MGDDIPLWISFTTCVSYIYIFACGYLWEFVNKLFHGKQKHMMAEEGYAPLLRDFDDFWNRRAYGRIQDAWNRPIESKPGATIRVLDRKLNNYTSKMEFTGKKLDCINLSSYNYLGFAENPPSVNAEVHASIDQYGMSCGSSQMEMGMTAVIRDLEATVARFVGKPAAVVYGMGFATNSTTIPCLVEKDSLIISDHLNHSSLVTGCRLSGAKIRVFRHNDFDGLDQLVRKSIIEGNPRTKAPWNKILIVIEGVYSMEGEIVDLPKVVAIKKKYNCYLYVDEAHSIGALGKRGGGVCDHWGVNPNDVDILMGTFSKSFGSAGGYAAASEDIIAHIRRTSAGLIYANSMSPPCAQQVISSMKVIMGEDGTDIGKTRLQALRDNSTFFRRSLIAMGFSVFGSDDSPVVIAMLYHPAKIIAVSRECLKRGLAIVVVGYPACPLLESRVRFCISAVHTREQLTKALDIMDDVGDLLGIKYKRGVFF